MRNNQKTGDAARRTLVALRKALGMTQQTFAVEILKTAVATVARYETSNPPRGDVLLRLSDIAGDHGQAALRAEFLCLYVDEVLENLKFNMMVVPQTGKQGPHGYLLLKLEGQQQIDDAIELIRKRRGPVDARTEATRTALDLMLSGRAGGEKK